MARSVIVSAVRTPFGKLGGSLGNKEATELGAIAIRAALDRAGLENNEVEYVIMGQVLQGGAGQAPARQASIGAGLPIEIGSDTINKVCASSIRAVEMADQMIRAGDHDVVVAGGMESMSNAPFYAYGLRTGVKFGDQTLVDGLIKDGLWCSFCDVHMGGHAEYTAKKCSITRQAQDEFALASHRKAIAAIDAGRFSDEIVPVEIAGKKGPTMVSTDESPRRETSLEQLAKLRPAFPKDAPRDMAASELTVTAGNAPGLNDGASALVVTSLAYAQAHGLAVLARITGYATGGGEPRDLFFAPIFAVQNLMRQTGAAIGDYDLIEANEAFASQAIADGTALGWDWDRVNVNGGAIALGHPIGASGARVLTTLLYAMRDRDAHTGLATLCLGGGNAVALSVERMS
jgi:acetyl-CoA C-acetyltransferase